MKLHHLLIALILLPQIALADCWDKAKVMTSQLEETVRAHETTKQALITIRRNAQDWKNLLLRGNVEKDKENTLFYIELVPLKEKELENLL